MRHLLLLSLILTLFGCGTNKYTSLLDTTKNQVEVSLDRSPCYGTCPVYSVNFNLSTKEATFKGLKFTRLSGERTFTLTNEEVSSIIDGLKNCEYLGLSDSYDGAISDIPSCTTALIINGEKLKGVYNRYDGPDALIIFETHLDNIVMTHLGSIK
jgi:hypothetical protein